MVVGIQRCCITATCWTVLCLIYSGITISCVKWCKMEMFMNVAASENDEYHLRCLKDYFNNLPETMCERDLRHSPLPARQLFGSIDVYFSHLLALLRHTVGILYLYKPLHSTPLLGLCAKRNTFVTSMRHQTTGTQQVNKSRGW